MAKIRRDGHWVSFWCPGCEMEHEIAVAGPTAPKAVWTLTGGPFKPTAKPSVLVRNPKRTRCCHLWMTEGRLQYLSDCTHALAGQTVDMQDMKEE